MALCVFSFDSERARDAEVTVSSADGGRFVQPMFVYRVEDREGRMLAQFEPVREAAEALPRPQALELVNVMRGVVDEGTGAIQLVRHVTVADVGKAINPQHVQMQDEGAAVMGLGHTLMEHILLDESGRIRNLGALDYRIPTTKDLPLEMHSLVVENGDGPGPYGSKGAGE